MSTRLGKTWRGGEPFIWLTGGALALALLLVAGLIGLILYLFLSPITKLGIRNLAAAMRMDAVRFFTVEHLAGMIIGIALVHIGRVKIRKTTDASRKHRLAMIFFGIALVVIIISIPWPGMPVARPLLRP